MHPRLLSRGRNLKINHLFIFTIKISVQQFNPSLLTLGNIVVTAFCIHQLSLKYYLPATPRFPEFVTKISANIDKAWQKSLRLDFEKPVQSIILLAIFLRVLKKFPWKL